MATKGTPLTGNLVIAPGRPYSSPSFSIAPGTNALARGLAGYRTAALVREVTEGRGPVKAVWLTAEMLDGIVEAMNELHRIGGDGIVVTWDWGEPDEFGFHTPVFAEHITVHIGGSGTAPSDSSEPRPPLRLVERGSF